MSTNLQPRRRPKVRPEIAMSARERPVRSLYTSWLASVWSLCSEAAAPFSLTAIKIVAFGFKQRVRTRERLSLAHRKSGRFFSRLEDRCNTQPLDVRELTRWLRLDLVGAGELQQLAVASRESVR